MPVSLKLLDIQRLTHDVKRYTLERPADWKFVPGQATELLLDRDGWRDKGRPFTFTCLPDAKNLEFTIKSYRDHNGVTKQLDQLSAGDHVLAQDIFGAIAYRGEGTFLAGGAGVTPFIAILRDLKRQNKLGGNRLLFSNKTAGDIIMEDEFRQMLGDNAVFTLTREEQRGYLQGRIDAHFLKHHNVDFTKPIYLCGPPPMVKALTETLKTLGVTSESLVIEE